MSKVRKAQEGIYRELLSKHKGTPMAVSSESLAHKKLRFDLISRMFSGDKGFTLHDVGMGIADFGEYLQKHHGEKQVIYSGTEILEEYCEEAKRRFPGSEFFCRDIADRPYEDEYDYIIMSGVFHQRRDTAIPDWEKFAQDIIRNSFKMCNRGVAFNLISPFVDFYQTQVYYSNLPKFINFINDELSRFFVISHDYALFEYTVFVFKEDYIKSKYTEIEFQKYF